MKLLAFLSLFATFVSTAKAQLSSDFLCEAKTKEGKSFQVVIPDLEFAREVIINEGPSTCSFPIESSFYNEHSVANQMLINFKASKECKLSNNIKPLKEGFIKIVLNNRPEVYVLALIGHSPLLCKMKSLKLDKLKKHLQDN